MQNYFAAEEQIVQRLREQVPELEAIYTATDLNDVPEMQQKFPCAHVLYHEDRVLSGEGGRSSTKEVQLVDQAWYVVVAVRNVKDQITGRSARNEAGPIIMKVLKALQGWQPTIEHGPMARVNGARAGYKAGYLYTPFLFTTRITV